MNERIVREFAWDYPIQTRNRLFILGREWRALLVSRITPEQARERAAQGYPRSQCYPRCVVVFAELAPRVCENGSRGSWDLRPHADRPMQRNRSIGRPASDNVIP